MMRKVDFPMPPRSRRGRRSVCYGFRERLLVQQSEVCGIPEPIGGYESPDH